MLSIESVSGAKLRGYKNYDRTDNGVCAFVSNEIVIHGIQEVIPIESIPFPLPVSLLFPSLFLIHSKVTKFIIIIINDNNKSLARNNRL